MAEQALAPSFEQLDDPIELHPVLRQRRGVVGQRRRVVGQRGTVISQHRGVLGKSRCVSSLNLGETLEIGLDLIEATLLAHQSCSNVTHSAIDLFEQVVDRVNVGVELVDLAFDLGHPQSIGDTREQL